MFFICSALVYGLFEFIWYKHSWRTLMEIFRDSFDNSYNHTYTGYWLGCALRRGILLGLTIGFAIGALIWSNFMWNGFAIIAGASIGSQIAKAIVNRFYDPLEELSKTFNDEKMNQ